MRRLALPALLVVMLPLRAAAQTPDDTTGYVHISPAVGFHYGVPLKISVAAGGLFDFRGPHDDGVIAMAEMGQGGGELSIGYFRMIRFGQGFDVRLAGLRTLPDPRSAAPETTYLGAEAHVMFLLGVGGRIGYFRRATPYSGPNTYDNVGSFRVSVGL
ncbi:MAG: hypothetical protein DMD35_03685 [Gemmatimonadetes bacterium]|nr:MAG: hypothetical protein DMD35_03685 [Gemmatimonadota bacterium]